MKVTRRQCLSSLILATMTGCQGTSMPRFSSLAFWDRPNQSARSQSPDEDKDDSDEFKTSVKTPMVGELATAAGQNLIVLQGVGLVTGLNGTGGDPPPSPERTALLEDMKRRGVEQPNRLLMDKSTALVVVRAYLPPLVKQGDHFDVEVRMVGNEGSSLNGGYLLDTYLSEAARVKGHGVLKGHVFARAEGPILISSGEDNKESERALYRRGRILGGGVSLKDRDMALILRNDFKSVRNTGRIAKVVGERFYAYDRHGIKEPLAKGLTDQKIELKILPRYKDNFPRYLNVIRRIAFTETEQARYVRLQLLKEKLNNPVTAEVAAVELEGIGNDAIPYLKTGLKNDSLEVQFHAATALAYLQKADGLPVLAKCVREEPAFRVFALAAMSICEDAESTLQLQKLLNEKSAETRYGAFRALTTMDEDHPVVRGEKMPNGFRLHVLDTDKSAPPMIHLTTHQKAEIVLFGAHQQFKTPIAIQAGEHIRISAPAGSDTVTISRYQLGKPDRRKVVSTDIAEIIRTVASEEFDASYPDVAQMLFQASKQMILTSRMEIDAVPESGRLYVRPQAGEGAKKSKTHVGGKNDTPNLFGPGKQPDESDIEKSSETTSTGKKQNSDQKAVKSEPGDQKTDKDDRLADARRLPPNMPEEDDDRKDNAFQRARRSFRRFIGEEREYAEAPSESEK